MDAEFLKLILSLFLLTFTVIGTGALSGLYSERAGVINIAIEGFMVMGGLVYSVLSLYTPHTKFFQIPAFLISMICVGFLSFLHSYASIQLKANQIISGTAINLLAAGVALFVVNVVYHGGVSGITTPYKNFAFGNSLSSWGRGFALSTFLTVLLFIISYFLIRKTKFGLRLRAAGENPYSLDTQGVSVVKMRYTAVFISGMLAGLGGAFFVQWHRVFHATVNGLGFVSLAVLIFGRWRLQWVLLAAVFFSLLIGVANATLDAVNAPAIFQKNSNLISALPFFVALAALAILGKSSQGPASSGIPYERSVR